jgi:hypothetical protein
MTISEVGFPLTLKKGKISNLVTTSVEERDSMGRLPRIFRHFCIEEHRNLLSHHSREDLVKKSINISGKAYMKISVIFIPIWINK